MDDGYSWGDKPENKKISIKEFRDKGYLQELNRHFLHPLGLSLSVTECKGDYSLGGISDCRDDLEGVRFAGSVFVETSRKANYIEKEWEKRMKYRAKHLGYAVQTVKDMCKDIKGKKK